MDGEEGGEERKKVEFLESDGWMSFDDDGVIGVKRMGICVLLREDEEGE